MARKKQEEAKGGAPAWMATFGDLMNLLLCFFVLLFSMSSVDSAKFEKLVASFQNSFSILPAGGTSVGDGQMISAGISQLESMDVYFKEMSNTQTQEEQEKKEEVTEAYQKQALEESEQMAEAVEEALQKYGIQNEVEVHFNAEYVSLNMNGALLFDSASAKIRKEAYPLMDKIGKILESYPKNIIDVEGHTDNVPINSSKYEDNNVLSMFRALTVADYLREITTINASHIKSSGRGEYVPVADNTTPEGRARNRRVEIKIYNSYNSDTN